MGSSGGWEVIEGPSLQAAYEAAVGRARDEHGWDPYNGTISTTGGVGLFTQTPHTHAEAQQLVELIWDRTTKWEQVLAVPLLPDPARLREFRGTLALAGDEHPHDAAMAAARQRLRAGERVQEVIVDAVAPKLRRSTTVPKEKVELRYAVLDGYGREVGGLHPTQAKARAAAEKIARESSRPGEWRVAARKYRGNHDGLVVVRNEVVSRRVEWTATAGRPPAKAAVNRWLVAGWYAC